MNPPLTEALVPTRRERIFFAVTLLVLGLVVSALLLYKPVVLLVAAVVSSALLLIAWLTRHAWPPRGLPLPLVLLAFHQLGSRGFSAAAPGALLFFALLGALTWWSAAFGNLLYRRWIHSVEPIGWSFSCLLFAGLFFLVVTPIGLTMRLLRYDPLQRKLDRDASTYWEARPPAPAADRYFRQF